MKRLLPRITKLHLLRPTVGLSSRPIPCSRLSRELFYTRLCPGVGSARYMSSTIPVPPYLLFRQLFDYQSYTYTYLLADQQTKDAILIDPVRELVNRDVHLLQDLQLNLKYALNTHCHADHITGTGELKKRFVGCKSVISKASGAKADIYICDGDQVAFGNQTLDVLSTPGHTNGCVTFVLHHDSTPVFALTGDALLIRGWQDRFSRRLFSDPL